MELPEIVTIKKVVKENAKVKTFFFDMKIKALPGQFVMVWLPGVDEKPFALSYNDAITVERKGVFTKKMFNLKKGSKIGVRGPYGKGFNIKKKALVVAGGLGIACLAGLVDKLKGSEVILGARSKKELLFAKRFKKANIATDNGSFGFKGFVTELMKELLKKKKFKVVYTCGPEIMMQKVFEVCEKKKIACEASLERYMKCGIGVCGSCACGDQLVCRDGPVFNSKQLRVIEDFGKYAHLKTGKKTAIGKYAKWRSK